VAVGVLGVFVGVFAVFVSRRGVLLGLIVLAMGMMMGRLEVMVRGGVVTRGRLVVVLDRRVLVRFCHGSVLLC
jgi:hypothetical protein